MKKYTFSVWMRNITTRGLRIPVWMSLAGYAHACILCPVRRSCCCRTPSPVHAVFDLGVMAGGRTHACLWLSFVAALSHSPDFAPATHAHSAWGQQAISVVSALQSVSVGGRQVLAGHRRPADGMDAVGRVSDSLRQVVCLQMSSAEGITKYLEWFCPSDGSARTTEKYLS